jgi:hypothetical protein
MFRYFSTHTWTTNNLARYRSNQVDRLRAIFHKRKIAWITSKWNERQKKVEFWMQQVRVIMCEIRIDFYLHWLSYEVTIQKDISDLINSDYISKNKYIEDYLDNLYDVVAKDELERLLKLLNLVNGEHGLKTLPINSDKFLNRKLGEYGLSKIEGSLKLKGIKHLANRLRDGL